MSPVELWQVAALVLGPAGAAWVGVKTALNGTRQSVAEIKEDVKDLRAEVRGNREEIIRLQEHLS